MPDQLSVAFVCSGNICRSTMAEAVFSDLVQKNNLQDQFDIIDSFGVTGYHVGDSPDYRTTKVLKQHSIAYSHRAQKLTKADFNKFDYLFGMDSYHVSSMSRMKPKGSKAKVLLFGEYNEKNSGLPNEIRDPWYDSDMSGFETCYDQVVLFSERFLQSLN